MFDNLERSYNTTQGFARNLRLASGFNFWLQLGLAVVSIAILAFAIADPNFNLQGTKPMSGAGLLFAVGGLFFLAVSIFWAFTCTRLAYELQNDAGVYLGKEEIITKLWRGLFFNAVGLISTLLGIEAVVGTLIAKSLTQVEGLAIYNSSQLIEPLDLLVIQANINTIVAQSIGILVAAWLISRIGRHQIKN
ncbi:MAG: hypothetical protein Tsb0014_44300 [Pleurocapsa sp.]